MSGRPKRFDETEALDAAMSVFWIHGYDATSYDDLVRYVGIGRQSLYATFGNKRTLYVKCIERYADTVTQRAVDLLGEPGRPLRNIRRWFTQLSDVGLGRERRGCLLTNTAVELAPHDPALARLVRTRLRRVEKALHETLMRAAEVGELAQDVDTRMLASYLLNAAQGLLVMNRLGVGRKKLREIAAVTLSVIQMDSHTKFLELRS